jgi:hypothetical protein
MLTLAIVKESILVVVVTEVDSAIHNDGVDDGEEEEDR